MSRAGAGDFVRLPVTTSLGRSLKDGGGLAIEDVGCCLR